MGEQSNLGRNEVKYKLEKQTARMKGAFILTSEVVFLHHTGKCLENGESVFRGIEGTGRDKI